MSNLFTLSPIGTKCLVFPIKEKYLFSNHHHLLRRHHHYHQKKVDSLYFSCTINFCCCYYCCYNFVRFFAVSMLQFCTNFLQGRVQSPGNCAQYYDCTQNLTTVKECNYPDLYHVETRQCKHYTEVDCGGRRVFLDPCKLFSLPSF